MPRLFETILDQSEFIPLFAPFMEAARNLEPAGYLTPKLGRIPFQMLLLDVFGETPLFYALHDDLQTVERLDEHTG